MFTGIIQALGRIDRIEKNGGDVRLTVESAGLGLERCALGDSIAVNGACLTVVEKAGQDAVEQFVADVSCESLNATTLGELSEGSPVNLEAALLANAPLGGHIVTGHVDGVGRIVSSHREARSVRWVVQVPDSLAKYIARKGSICIDGASLTVNAVQGSQLSVNIIPHTAAQTLFGRYSVGNNVNIEIDLLARYVERLMLGEKAAVADAGLSKEFLAEHGFLSS